MTMEVTMWQSQTRRLEQREMMALWSTPALMLAEMIASSSPVVALRCLAEVMLNGDIEKLTTLLLDPQVNATWQAWQTDSGLDPHDQLYAAQLTEYRARMSNRRVGPVEAQLPDLPVLHVQVEDLNYPHHMSADDTSLWAPHYLEPGTRIILRCDQVNRPYFPTASYYEPGTVTSCNDHDTNGRYLMGFQHDPWPLRVRPTYSEYLDIRYGRITEFEVPHDHALETGTPVVIIHNISNENFYVWGEVIDCQQGGRNYTCRVRVLPNQV